MSNRGLSLRSLAGSNVGRMPPPAKCRAECPSWRDDAPGVRRIGSSGVGLQLLSCEARSILAKITVAQADCGTNGTRPRPVPKNVAREARVHRFRGSSAPWAPRAPRISSHPPPRKPNLNPPSGHALAACRVPAGEDGDAGCRRPFQPSWQHSRRPRMPPKIANARRSGRRMTPAGHKDWRIHHCHALNRGSVGGKSAAPIWRPGPDDSDAGFALLAVSPSQQTDRRRLRQNQRPSA